MGHRRRPFDAGQVEHLIHVAAGFEAVVEYGEIEPSKLGAGNRARRVIERCNPDLRSFCQQHLHKRTADEAGATGDEDAFAGKD